MFIERFYQNDMNFIRRLGLQEKKKLFENSRLDVVEISHVA